MNQLTEQQLHQHVTIVGWILILEHAVLLAVAGFVFVLLTGIGVASGDSQAMSILGIVGTSVGLFLAVLSIPGIVAGAGLLKRQAWGRYLSIAVAVLGLLNIPVGTLIGIYALWVLLQNSAGAYFRQPGQSVQLNNA